MEKTSVFKFNARRLAAWILLIAPLFAYPLVFGGTFAGRNFGFVEAVTPGVIGIFALGVAITFPERIIALGKSKAWFGRLVVLLCVLFLFWSLTRTLAFDAMTKFQLSLFYTALPLGCIAVGDELKKILPGALIGFGALAAIYGFFSPCSYGFLLNWNWNSTIVKIGIGALALRLFPHEKRKIFIAAALLLAVNLVVELSWRGNYFSLGSWLAIAFASLTLVLVNKIPEKKRGLCVGVAVLLSTVAILVLPQSYPQSRDCRVQLWRGTNNLVAQNWVTGVGAGNFEDRIQEALPAEFYYTRHLAPRHPHPHNETLVFLAAFGIAGGFFLAALLATAMHSSKSDGATNLLRWTIFVLFFHGSVDVLLSEALPGVLFYACAGALIELEPTDEKKWLLPRGICLAASFYFALFCAILNLLGSSAYRQAMILYQKGEPCDKALQRALYFRPDARTLYLAGWAHFRQGDFPAAQNFFTRIHTEHHLRGYFHSNYCAGVAAMNQGRYREAARFFEREERRYPFSITNAYAMAYLAHLTHAPSEFQLAARQKVLVLLAMRGKTRDDLGDFLNNINDDVIPCVEQKKER